MAKRAGAKVPRANAAGGGQINLNSAANIKRFTRIAQFLSEHGPWMLSVLGQTTTQARGRGRTGQKVMTAGE